MAKQQTFELPAFEGRRPEAADIAVSGTFEFGEHVAPVLHPDETVYAVVELRVIGVNHQTDSNDIFRRVHRARVSDIALLETEEGGDLLVDSRRAELERRGIVELSLNRDARPV